MKYLLFLLLLTGCTSRLLIQVDNQKPIQTYVRGDTLYIHVVQPDNYKAPQYGSMMFRDYPPSGSPIYAHFKDGWQIVDYDTHWVIQPNEGINLTSLRKDSK